jgi:hypothetical protein
MLHTCPVRPRLSFSLPACVLVLSGVASAVAVGSDAFPRVAGINIGSPHNYEDPGYQRSLAKLDLVILNYWPSWNNGRKATFNQSVEAIKRVNSSTQVYVYIVNSAQHRTNNTHKEVRDRVESSKAWLYPSGTAGTPVASEWDPTNFWAINNSVYSPKGADGKTFVEWYAEWVVNNYFKPNPAIDGFFTDTVFTRPEVQGDWNRDGVPDSKKAPDTGRWYREGYRKHFSLLNAAMPRSKQLGNVALWGNSDQVLTEYQGMLHGGVMEGIVGLSWSVETWAGFDATLKWYRRTKSAMRDPNMLIFNQHGSPTDYRAFRYGFGICLLDDAYHSFTDAKAGFTGVVWFDEYDVELGKATSAPPTAAWKQGVYRRDFENGIVLVNPKGNRAASIDMGSEFVRISGKQAPSINSGRNADIVTLQERDGIVLLRNKTTRPASRPRAPANLTVQ